MPEIEGYQVVPLKLTEEAQHCHSIYMREHFIRLVDEDKPKGRTLFLLNIPPYVTEDNLRTVFQRVGTVVSVMFAEKPGRDETAKWKQNCTEYSSKQPPYKFKVAYVVFKTTKSVAGALLLTSIDMFSKTTGESLVVSGMQLWHKEYEDSILDEEQMQSQIDKYMEKYDTLERAAFEKAKNSEADKDGWVTVGKQGHNAGFEQKESVINKLEERLARGKKNKELTNFYTFQIRESKMKHIVNLRKKFEEDKKKIEILKQTRRFRPF